jgi:hypothetical protein
MFKIEEFSREGSFHRGEHEFFALIQFLIDIN